MRGELKRGIALRKRDRIHGQQRAGVWSWAGADRAHGPGGGVDSFVSGEAAQFQAMACKLGTESIQDLINLTFCCQQATVITDFSDLEKVGRDHCMNLNGGAMPIDGYKNLDGRAEALKLILNEEGTVTPYGVVYDNGMELRQEYVGRSFPAYDYRGSLLTVELAVQERPDQESRFVWLHLPMPERQLDRAWIRAGVDKAYGVEINVVDSELPQQINSLIDSKYESAGSLNRMCQAIASLPERDRPKLAAAVMMTEANTASEIAEVAKNLDQFDFIPGVDFPSQMWYVCWLPNEERS